MKKWIFISILVLTATLLIGFFLTTKFLLNQAKLEIKTNVTASVFVDGKSIGQTPINYIGKPGELTIRLVPNSGSSPLAPWSTKVNLAPGVTTVVRRDFGPTDADSAGEVLSFEKIGGRTGSLSVVSLPDSAQVSIDGTPYGFTPIKVSQLAAGEHALVVSHPGYVERSIDSLRIEPGYNLTALVFLAREQNKEEDKSSGKEKKTFVEILSTPTGFLRVRQEPSTVSAELGRVKPSERYTYLGQNEAGDWFKIEYQGKEGWISSQYAKKVEEN
jgi:hypothetical protein